MSNGLIHLYHGDGKGKTTAAMGLAVRALGCGRRVVIVQFLKGGATGELEPLQTLGATFYRGKSGQKFVFQMNEEEKAATRALQTENLRRALDVHKISASREADAHQQNINCQISHKNLLL